MYKVRTVIAIVLAIVMIVGIVQACNNEAEEESYEERVLNFSTEYMLAP